MKFFYIDNTQCTECNRCITACPTGAIYVGDEKRYVDYDKCTSCGICIKSCSDDAIIFESVGQMVARMEKAAVYETRIRRLERELSLLKTRLGAAEKSLDKTVAQIPAAAFIAGADGRIMTANRAMISMAGIDPLLLADMPDNLAGESAASLIPAYAQQMSTARKADTGNINVINGTAVSVSVSQLPEGATLCIVRDLSDRNTAGEELLSILKSSIDRKMETVQKIGTLLGDEASAEISGLNAAIRIIEAGSEKNGEQDGGK